MKILNSNYSNTLEYHTHPLTLQTVTGMATESTFLNVQNCVEITLAAIKYQDQAI